MYDHTSLFGVLWHTCGDTGAKAVRLESKGAGSLCLGECGTLSAGESLENARATKVSYPGQDPTIYLYRRWYGCVTRL